ncbi:MAG: hypothetical protein IKS44_01880, partial [Bacteroidales bacterium]|nr:hypothetical protein [Bacteroidales bacterium]
YESEPLPFTLPKEFYGLGKDAFYVMDNSADYLEVTDVLGLLRDYPERFTLRDQRTGEEMRYIPTKRFKITLDIPALVEAGVIPESIAEQVPGEIRWEIGKQILYRHEMMLIDIIGTNKFMRDINIMNPNTAGIPEIYPPVRNYIVQDGMNYKFLPYPRRERYTDRTADYFIDGVDGEPLKWGNLNSDIYVDPISMNMSVVQRQSMTTVAYYEAEKGNLDKARKLVDLTQEMFPAKNFPHDVYSVYIYIGNGAYVDVVELYRKLYGEEEAIALWEDAFRYYDEEIAYLKRFKGEKMQGVRSKLQSDLQVMGLLGEIAQVTLKNEELVAKTSAVLGQYE